jgi:hypothetical protein
MCNSLYYQQLLCYQKNLAGLMIAVECTVRKMLARSVDLSLSFLNIFLLSCVDASRGIG